MDSARGFPINLINLTIPDQPDVARRLPDQPDVHRRAADPRQGDAHQPVAGRRPEDPVCDRDVRPRVPERRVLGVGVHRRGRGPPRRLRHHAHGGVGRRGGGEGGRGNKTWLASAHVTCSTSNNFGPIINVRRREHADRRRRLPRPTQFSRASSRSATAPTTRASRAARGAAARSTSTTTERRSRAYRRSIRTASKIHYRCRCRKYALRRLRVLGCVDVHRCRAAWRSQLELVYNVQC